MTKNRKSIIITAFIIVVAVLLIAFGIWGENFQEITYRLYSKFNPDQVTTSDIGKNYRINITDEAIDVGEEKFYFQVIEEPDVSDEDYQAFWYGLNMDKLSEEKIHEFLSAFETCDKFYIIGSLREYEESEKQELQAKLEAWLRSYYAKYQEVIVNYLGEDYTADKWIETEMANFKPYYFEVTDVVLPKTFNGIPYIVVGAVTAFLSFLFEICFVFKLRKRVVIPVVLSCIAAITLFICAILFNHLRTVFSIKEAGPGIYTMKNYECTNTQGMIDANLQSIEDFENWAVKEHYFNLGLKVERENLGCAAFCTTTPDGEHLFGRNFDYDTTDTVLIYSHPEGAYASIGCADMTFVDVGEGQVRSADSLQGKAYMIVLPYAIMDGINEAGLGVSILELVMDEIHEDEGKPDILIFTTIRALLDNCATVEDAVAFLDKFDVHSDLGNSYHLFITDKSGNYAVIEWLDGEMFVNRLPAVTNTVVTSGVHYNEGQADNRLEKIMNALNEETVITKEGAMDILNTVHQQSLTEWSCVYNLEDFSVDICLDADYEIVYTFYGSDFK